jgi:hypothetical protein
MPSINIAAPGVPAELTADLASCGINGIMPHVTGRTSYRVLKDFRAQAVYRGIFYKESVGQSVNDTHTLAAPFEAVIETDSSFVHAVREWHGSSYSESLFFDYDLPELSVPHYIDPEGEDVFHYPTVDVFVGCSQAKRNGGAVNIAESHIQTLDRN